MAAGIAYLRWREGEPRVSRVFPNPGGAIGHVCPGCLEPITSGPVVLVVVGPGDDPDAQADHAAGRWHSAATVTCHAACAGATP